MKVLYIADDGKQFDSDMECEEYEEKLKHPNMYGIIFSDEDNNEFSVSKEDPFNDDTYNKACKVVIHSEEELEDLKFLEEYCGWCEFGQITEPGTWVRFPLDSTAPWRGGMWMKVVDVDSSIIFLDIDDPNMDEDKLRKLHINTAKHLIDYGFTVSEVARIMGKPRSTVYRWVKK